MAVSTVQTREKAEKIADSHCSFAPSVPPFLLPLHSTPLPSVSLLNQTQQVGCPLLCFNSASFLWETHSPPLPQLACSLVPHSSSGTLLTLPSKRKVEDPVNGRGWGPPSSPQASMASSRARGGRGGEGDRAKFCSPVSLHATTFHSLSCSLAVLELV